MWDNEYLYSDFLTDYLTDWLTAISTCLTSNG